VDVVLGANEVPELLREVLGDDMKRGAAPDLSWVQQRPQQRLCSEEKLEVGDAMFAMSTVVVSWPTRHGGSGRAKCCGDGSDSDDEPHAGVTSMRQQTDRGCGIVRVRGCERVRGGSSPNPQPPTPPPPPLFFPGGGGGAPTPRGGGGGGGGGRGGRALEEKEKVRGRRTKEGFPSPPFFLGGGGGGVHLRCLFLTTYIARWSPSPHRRPSRQRARLRARVRALSPRRENPCSCSHRLQTSQ